MKGRKDDQGKAPLSLIPGVALTEIGKVLAFGANKYAPNGWKHVRPGHRYLDAALRHLHAFADGEDNDPESGLGHLAHAGCCVLFLIALRAAGVQVRWGEGEDLRRCSSSVHPHAGPCVEEFYTWTECGTCGQYHRAGKCPFQANGGRP
jgi:hypothetical protein